MLDMAVVIPEGFSNYVLILADGLVGSAGLLSFRDSEHPSLTSVLAGGESEQGTQEWDAPWSLLVGSSGDVHLRDSTTIGFLARYRGRRRRGCQKLMQVAAEGRTMHCNYRIPDIVACRPKHLKGGQRLEKRTVFSSDSR
ncbi:uncharacterized protein B0H64DRAFT_459142 [Chaetomium fimeti]|uniref:Uncharacterized protein n=1 Tax=Chaetomium fimeti TaxID=1854472 RepID=A0AAE0LRX5_9PEZI|nr:hypothetical protein B0H64DRAFT_459142 [Chaetomium fimeti]